MTYQAQKIKPLVKRVYDYLYSDQLSDRRFHSPSISKSTLDSTVPPYPITKNVLLIPNQVAPIPTSNGYTNLYSYDSEDNPVFEEIFSNYKTVNSINTSSVVPQILTLASTPIKMLKKQRKIRVSTQLATIKQAQSDTTSSAIFLSTELYSVSQAITRAHTENIALYNNTDTYWCADSGASEYMFTD